MMTKVIFYLLPLLWVSLAAPADKTIDPKGSLPVGHCPYPDLDHPVYLPDLFDPTKFYECSNGFPHLLHCPDGLHFDTHLNVCANPKSSSRIICPVPDPEQPVYFPDPWDPSKFYECSNGVPYPFDCPEGLHFNPYTNRCDYPGFSTPEPTGAPSGPSGSCPYPDPEYPVYLTDLSDPGRFYECSNGVPYPFDCPAGLHFNPDLNVCG